ncbi:MAG: GreA/GreB family elongation factor [Chthoniobacteraceae bacterium]
MSKAFTKEDDAPLERSTRMRSTSGLPPGAVNYMTAEGARRLRTEFAALTDTDVERAAEIGRILASATIVEPPVERPAGAVFGALVEARDSAGRPECFRIVGVDEVNLDPRWVSWTSATGRSLLGTEPGQRVTLEVGGERRKLIIVRIDY